MTNDESRKNDGARMPKRLICPPGAFRHSVFGFLLSFVIRYSSLATPASPLVLALLVSCSKPAASGVKTESDDALPITVERVEVVPMDQALDIWGTLYAKDEAMLGAEVEGKVEKT